jgi:ribosomal protein S18 acetylase RimI-like enzyme
VSVNIDTRVAGPGNDEFAEAAWKLKERIRHEEGVLKQRKGFFMDAYRRSTVYLLLEEPDEELMGFAATRRDGYILFLAVATEYRGEGFGARLVHDVAEDYSTVTCHARATNTDALGFYEHLGFEVKRRVDNYYEDGGAAYYLRLGEEGLAERISKRLF